MAQDYYNIKICAGATYKLNVNYVAGGLTSAVIEGQFRRKVSSDTVDYTIGTVAGNITIVDDTNFMIIIPSADTSTLSGNYAYDVEVLLTSGEKVRPIQGTVAIDPEVTR